MKLALKDAFDKSGFNEINKLYLEIYNLCENTEAIKTDIRETEETLNISIYSFSRLTGAPFTPHYCKVLTHLLLLWPAIAVTLENTIVVCCLRLRLKITGFLKQLKNYQT